MHELELITTGESTQIISDHLLELGALAITWRDAEDNPIFEPPPESLILWPSIKLSALFATDAGLDEILLQIYAKFGDAILEARKVAVEDQDWVRETQRQFHPMCFGERLWIYPSWEPAPENDDVKILLDPGLAFGTGTHPTTGLILTWLAKNPPTNKKVLDYGCGSGILAIAAAKLGASKVWCTDIDPQALLASRENAERNNISDTQLLTCFPEELSADLKIDVLLANILAEPLCQLAPQFKHFLHAESYVVLSGILTTQIPEITAVYEQDFVPKEIHIEADWACMVWKVKPNNPTSPIIPN